MALRRTFIVSSLIASLLIGAGSLPATAQTSNDCVARTHDCGERPLATSCCCGRHQDRSTPATLDNRAPLASDVSSANLAAAVLFVVPMPAFAGTVHTAPLRGSPPDLSTLYATLLI